MGLVVVVYRYQLYLLMQNKMLNKDYDFVINLNFIFTVKSMLTSN